MSVLAPYVSLCIGTALDGCTAVISFSFYAAPPLERHCIELNSFIVQSEHLHSGIHLRVLQQAMQHRAFIKVCATDSNRRGVPHMVSAVRPLTWFLHVTNILSIEISGVWLTVEEAFQCFMRFDRSLLFAFPPNLHPARVWT